MLQHHLPCISVGGVFSPHKITSICCPQDRNFVAKFCCLFLHLVILFLHFFFSLHLFNWYSGFQPFFSCSLFPVLPELSSSICSHQFDWVWHSSTLIFFPSLQGQFCLLLSFAYPIGQFRQLVWHLHVFSCFCMHSLFSL